MEKYWNLLEEIKKAAENGEVALIYYFEDTHAEILKILDKTGLSYRENEKVIDANIKVVVWSLDEAKKQVFGSGTTILVAEVLPLKSATMELIASQEPGQNLTFFASLDSVFFDVFGGERIRALMQNLGMQENERIEHSMVTKSIERAQEKLEAKATNPDIQTSIEDWVEANAST